MQQESRWYDGVLFAPCMEADVQQFTRKFRLWESCLGLFDQYAYEHTMTSKK